MNTSPRFSFLRLLTMLILSIATLTSPTAGALREVTIAGWRFKASNRTIWHLRWTIFVLKVRFPRAILHIIQPCYHEGVDASAGTHDKDCVLDFWITGGVLGKDPWRAQKIMRKLGWAIWFRHTGTWVAKSAWHLHGISLPLGLPPHPTALDVGRAFKRLGIVVGEFIDGGYTTTGRVTTTSQVVDYFNHAEGLKGEHDQNDDPSWHPDDINATVFRRSWWFKRTAA